MPRFRLALICAISSLCPISAAVPRGLDIWFVDTEGGAATLLVTPAGESVLIDCGNPGARDAERIYKVAQLAGLKALDHLAITHWHLDHYGSLPRLSKLIPIRNFWDRGVPETLEEDKKNFPLLIQGYREASGNKSKALKPGDVIPLKAAAGALPLKLFCLCANKETIADQPGAKENPVARDHKPMPEDKSDNARSLGFLLSYGGFRFLDLGDLTWNIEHRLVAPSDKIGPVDVYQTTHHGLDISNNPVVINTVKPRVAIYNNGPRKGAAASVTATLRRVDGLKAIYQLHRNLTVGAQENTAPEFIANPDEKCLGEWIRVSVTPDAKSYTVTVGSKGKTHRYATRASD